MKEIGYWMWNKAKTFRSWVAKLAYLGVKPVPVQNMEVFVHLNLNTNCNSNLFWINFQNNHQNFIRLTLMTMTEIWHIATLFGMYMETNKYECLQRLRLHFGRVQLSKDWFLQTLGKQCGYISLAHHFHGHEFCGSIQFSKTSVHSFGMAGQWLEPGGMHRSCWLPELKENDTLTAAATEQLKWQM